MKKLIKSIIAFFFNKDVNAVKAQPSEQQVIWEGLSPGKYYAVYLYNEWQSYEENLMDVSREYSYLKKSTLYSAFKKGKIPRTYTKTIYTVKECQKF